MKLQSELKDLVDSTKALVMVSESIEEKAKEEQAIEEAKLTETLPLRIPQKSAEQ